MGKVVTKEFEKYLAKLDEAMQYEAACMRLEMLILWDRLKFSKRRNQNVSILLEPASGRNDEFSVYIDATDRSQVWIHRTFLGYDVIIGDGNKLAYGPRMRYMADAVNAAIHNYEFGYDDE